MVSVLKSDHMAEKETIKIRKTVHIGMYKLQETLTCFMSNDLLTNQQVKRQTWLLLKGEETEAERLSHWSNHQLIHGKS